MSEIRNYVVFISGLKRTHSHNAGIERIKLARHQRLKSVYNLRTDDNRVLAKLRRLTMGADAFNDNIDTIDIGECITGCISDVACGIPSRRMGRQHIIRLGKRLV